MTSAPPRCRPLVCLHGWLGSPADFDPLFDSLCAVGWPEDRHPLVAVDLPSIPDAMEQPSRLPDRPSDGDANDNGARVFADAIEELATAIHERLRELHATGFRLLGYSMGGRAAFGLLARALAIGSPAADRDPDVSRRIEQATIIGAHPGLASPRERAARRAADFALADEIDAAADTAQFDRFLERWYDQDLFASLRAHPNFAECSARRRRLDPRRATATLRRLSTGNQPPRTDRLLPIPVRTVAGALDVKYDTLLTEWSRCGPSRAHSTIAAVGHAVHLEAAPQLAGVLQRDLADPSP